MTVFILALAVRAYFLWKIRASPFAAIPIVDAKEYHLWAKALLEGRGLLGLWADHSPVYPLFLAAVYRVCGFSPWPVFALQAVLGAAMAGLCFASVWRSGRRLWAAVAAGLLAACAWPCIYPTGSLLPSVLEMFLVAGGLFMLSAPRAPSWPAALAAGCALGLACSLRPPMIAAVAALAAALGFLRRGWTWRAVLAGVLPWIFLSLAWSLYLSGHGVSAFLQTRSGMNLYLGNHAGASGMAADFPGLEYLALRHQASAAGARLSEQDAYFFDRAWDWLQAQPGAGAGLWLRKLGLALARCEIPSGEAQPWLGDGTFRGLRSFDFALLLALGLPGLLCGLWRREAASWELAGFLAAGLAALALGTVAARYRAPLLPALILGAGCGVRSLHDWLARRRRRGVALLVLAMAGVYLICVRLDALAGIEPRRELGIALSLQARGGGGEARRAQELLSQWTDSHPEDWDAAWHLGLIQAHLRDWRGAEATFRRLAQARGRDWPQLNSYLAWLRALTGDPAGARDAAEASWRDDPRSLDACLRAVLYAQLTDPDYPSARVCLCPLDAASRRPAAPAAESLAAVLLEGRARLDLRTALPFIEESAWETEGVDYPADDLRRIFGRRRGALVPLSCSR